MNNPKREKRAYVAYLSELIRKQKEDSNLIVEDGNHISAEIYHAELHIKDLDFVIEVQEHSET
jgi:hypothetical protein